MFIQELAQVSGVPANTIRYYESIGLPPEPEGGRIIIAGARSLGFALAARDTRILPHRRVLDWSDQRILDIATTAPQICLPCVLRCSTFKGRESTCLLMSSVMNDVSIILPPLIKRSKLNVRPLWKCHRRWKCHLHSRLVRLFLGKEKQ